MPEQKDISIRDNTIPTSVWAGSYAESASRIVTAVYMVTSFISDTEPLKGHLRSKALSCFSEVVAHLKDTKGTTTTLTVSFEELMSLISTAGLSGLMSTMNRDILIAEIGRLIEALGQISKNKDQVASQTMQHMFSKTIVIPKAESLLDEKTEKIYKGHSKGKISTNVLYKKPQQRNVLQKNGNGDRREHILRILKEKGETTIKDIASGIAGCSEKTIQRDLNDMVEKGTIKKKGERRWTTYFVS